MMMVAENLEFLAGWVHGRRSQLAEGRQAEALCRVTSHRELWRALVSRRPLVGPTRSEPSAEASAELGLVELQHRLASGWLLELDWLAASLSQRRCRLIEALASGLQPEVREGTDPSSAPSAGDSEQRLSVGDETGAEQRRLRGILVALAALDAGDRRVLGPLLLQEVDRFHLLLVSRGHFLRGLPVEAILPWHLEGTNISRSGLAAMLEEPDLVSAAARAVGLALDALPPAAELDAAQLDARARRRTARLARLTFRAGGMGFPAIAAYAVLRRLEVADLVTISEGIRLGLPADALRARLILSPSPEAARARA